MQSANKQIGTSQLHKMKLRNQYLLEGEEAVKLTYIVFPSAVVEIL